MCKVGCDLGRLIFVFSLLPRFGLTDVSTLGMVFVGIEIACPSVTLGLLRRN